MNGPPEWRRECAACEGEGRIEHPHMPLHGLRSEAPEYAVVDCENCGGAGWNWTDEPVSLTECRPGPFWFNGSLGLKTEYGMTLPNGMGMWTVTHWPEAYCMASGECFWGGTSKHEDRAKLQVWPIEQLIVATAQVGTHPQGGDAKQAPGASLSDAVGEADAPNPSVHHPPRNQEMSNDIPEWISK